MGYFHFESPKIFCKDKIYNLGIYKYLYFLILKKLGFMKKVLMVLLGLFIIIQFFPVEKTNPPVNKGMDFLTIKKTPEKEAAIIKNSCYDCHSNETVYPWYSNVQPIGWFLQEHFKDGRKHLNFSSFATYEPKKQIHKLEEAIDEIKKGDMPLQSYTLVHQDAVLSPEEQSLLMKYFEKDKNEIARKSQMLK